ncbi:MAG TPA: hypothetical protein VJ654_18670 [Noviherbaspirillum sp.]|nr:hypothetical protein [Noviherbaspirillum sp.]
MKTGHTAKVGNHAVPKKTARQAASKQVAPPPSPFAGKPLDGSQYHDVIEEQAYAEKRSSPEEEKPRFSYLNKQEAQGRRK